MPAAAKATGTLTAALAEPGVEYMLGLMKAAGTADSGSPAEAADKAEAGIAGARDRIEQAHEELETLRADSRHASPEPVAPEEPLSPEDAKALGALALELVRSKEGLRGRDLAGADLTGANLAGLDLSGVFLEQAALKGANLAGADLHKAVLTGADLTGADLTGANLGDGNLSSANMIGGPTV